ncbi:MAG: hypothetical protein QM477_11025 [Planctomycetota bacterium]
MFALAALLLGFTQTPQASPVQIELEVRRAITALPLETGAEVYAGETLLLTLRFNMEKDFLEQQLLPQWGYPFDVQADLRTPWLESAEAYKKLGSAQGGSTSLVIDRESGFALRLPDHGDGCVHFQLEQAIEVLSGPLELAPAQLKVVWATGFEEDMVRGPVAIDRQSQIFTTAPFEINVLPVPMAGRPREFSGAVGDFQMSLMELPELSPRQLQLSFLGRGHLLPDHLPNLDHLLDFPIQGQRLETVESGFVLHLETESKSSFPLLRWSYFHPGKKSFVTQSVGAEPLPADEVSELRWPWLGGVLLLLCGLFWLRGSNRGKQRQVSMMALEPFTKSELPADLVDDLTQLLSCKREQIYMDSFEQEIQAQDLPADLTQDLLSAVQAIVLARYAEQGTAPDDNKLDALRERLQATCKIANKV